MGNCLKNTLLFSLFLFSASIVVAQNAKPKKNEKQKTEEVEKPPPPPPPMEELKEVVIDTSSTIKVDNSNSIEDEYFPPILMDTSAVPEDDLTIALRKMLLMSGAFDLGVQFAKSLNSGRESDESGLPKEFYDRLYSEISGKESKRHFENQLIKVYRKYYTLADVNGILAFYSSEVGKKMLSSLPIILNESQEVGMSFGRYLGMKVFNDLVNEGIIK